MGSADDWVRAVILTPRVEPAPVGPQRVPVLLVFLDAQLAVEVTLQFELGAGVALVVVVGLRDERVVGAAAKGVHPVTQQAVVVALEGEDGGEQARAVAGLDQRVGGEVDGGDEVLELLVVEDDPLVAVVVAGEIRGRPGLDLAGLEDGFDLPMASRKSVLSTSAKHSAASPVGA